MEDNNLYEICNKEIILKDPLKIKQYQKNKFIAPEIQNITTARATIQSRSPYYNLARLTLFCLTNQYLENGDWDKYLSNIGPITHTKLCWSLKRCLVANTRERYYLVI